MVDYEAELRAAGALPVHALVVAFDGKHVRVVAAGAPGDAESDRSNRRKKAPKAGRARES